MGVLVAVVVTEGFSSGVAVAVIFGSWESIIDASSNMTVVLPDGRSMSRKRAERASDGARTGPTDNIVQPFELVFPPSSVERARPEPSVDVYQEIRMNVSPDPAAKRAHTEPEYQPSPSILTAWYTHFVDDVVDSKSAMPPRLATFCADSIPANLDQPFGRPADTESKEPLVSKPPESVSVVPPWPGRGGWLVGFGSAVETGGAVVGDVPRGVDVGEVFAVAEGDAVIAETTVGVLVGDSVTVGVRVVVVEGVAAVSVGASVGTGVEVAGGAGVSRTDGALRVSVTVDDGAAVTRKENSEPPAGAVAVTVSVAVPSVTVFVALAGFRPWISSDRVTSALPVTVTVTLAVYSARDWVSPG